MSLLASTLRLTLRAGSVYKLIDRSLRSPEPHYFVVINRDPFAKKVLLMTVITSRVDKVLKVRATSPDTVVVIEGASEFSELSKRSAVDCNWVMTKSLEEFTETVLTKDAKPCADIPPEILCKIIAATRLSPLIDQAIKDLL